MDALIKQAFFRLMGANGGRFVEEIKKTGCLSQSSYDQIVDNVRHNGQTSIIEFFGVVQWYYFKGQK